MITGANLITITPEQAARLLTLNRRNRRMRMGFVRYLADQLRKGRWVVTTDCVGLRDDGALANGQHRLAAIVMAGIAADVLWVEGVDEATWRAIDTGNKRSNADALEISNVLSADCKFIAELTNRVVGSRVSNEVVAEIALFWQSAYQALYDSHAGGSNSAGCNNVSVRIAAGLQFLRRPTKPDQRLRILAQYHALLSAEVDKMSKAVGLLWKRQTRARFGRRTKSERVDTLLFAYRCFDPTRDSVEPQMRQPDVIMAEIVAELTTLEESAVRMMNYAMDSAMAAKAQAPASQTILPSWNERLRGAAVNTIPV